jgi:hypothetical protein
MMLKLGGGEALVLLGSATASDKVTIATVTKIAARKRRIDVSEKNRNVFIVLYPVLNNPVPKILQRVQELGIAKLLSQR